MRGDLENPDLRSDPGVESLRADLTGPRPERGWIRAMRQSAGISAGELGRILGVSRQLPLQFEKAEADDSITLKSLRMVANALGCDLVYALAPRAGAKLEHNSSREPKRKHAHEDKRPNVENALAPQSSEPAVEAEGADPEAGGENTYFCD
jgi:transcriptional regulator with XRE-family HTH domain